MLRMSAESRLAASSNDVRVRVDGSRKKRTTVRPRRAGTFLMGLGGVLAVSDRRYRLHRKTGKKSQEAKGQGGMGNILAAEGKQS